MSKKNGKVSGSEKSKVTGKAKNKTKGTSQLLKKTILGVTTAAIAAGAGGSAAQAAYFSDALECAKGGVSKVIGGTVSTVAGTALLGPALLSMNKNNVKMTSNAIVGGLSDIVKGAGKTLIGAAAAPLGLVGDTAKWAYKNPGKTAAVVGTVALGYLGYQYMQFKTAQFDAQSPVGGGVMTVNTQNFFGDHLKSHVDDVYHAVSKNISASYDTFSTNIHDMLGSAKSLLSENWNRFDKSAQSWFESFKSPGGSVSAQGASSTALVPVQGQSDLIKNVIDNSKALMAYTGDQGASPAQGFTPIVNGVVPYGKFRDGWLNKVATASSGASSTALVPVSDHL